MRFQFCACRVVGSRPLSFSKPSDRIAGAALHGERACNQGFFNQRLNLHEEAGLAPCEQAESFDGGAAYHIRRIVVERHQQARCAQPVSAGLRNSSDNKTEVGAGPPVVSCFPWPNLAEEPEQPVYVGCKQLRLPFCDSARCIGSVMPEDGIASEESAEQRLKQLRMGEDFSGRPACLRQSPHSRVEFQAGLDDRTGHRKCLGSKYKVARLTISS